MDRHKLIRVGVIGLLFPLVALAQPLSTSSVVSLNTLANAAYCADTSGAANTITCTTAVGFTGYAAGQAVDVLLANSVTGATTIAVNGLAAKAVTYNGATALISGIMSTGGTYRLQYDGTRFVLQGSVNTATTGTQTFNASGTFTVPTLINRVRVEVWSGGAGGAGGATTTGGAGGSGGGYVDTWCAVTPGAAVTVTIGAGGALGAVNTVGSAGGNSVFGSCATAVGAPAQATVAAAQTGGYDNTSSASIAQNANSALLYYRNTIAPGITATLCTNGSPPTFPLINTNGGCNYIPPSADGIGSIGGHSVYGAGAGGSGAFGVVTTRAGGLPGLSGYGGNGGTGASVTTGTPNADCTAGTQPGGGGGGGAGAAGSQSAGCAGAAGRVVVWW